MDYKYVSMDRIFSKVIREYTSDFDELDVVEMVGEALEFIGAVKYYEEAVAFVEIKNHQGELPKWLHAVIQIAKDNNWSPKTPEKCVKPFDVIKDLKEGKYCKTELQWSEKDSEYILLDCDGQPVYDYEIAYYRPYFDLQMEYYGWTHSMLYRTRFTPVRLADNSFFNSIVCKEFEENTIYASARDEYQIIQGKIVRTSFRNGMVAIAYLRQVRDLQTGYPMIPDNISYITAITRYIRMTMVGRRAFGSAEYNKLEEDWQWYCAQASNVDKMPYGIDEHQNMLDQRQYLVPKMNNYYSFFGNLSRPEVRQFNDPNRRNIDSRYNSSHRYIGN